MAWADHLHRVFALEVLLCACGGERRIIAAIDEGPVARKIRQHLGLPSTLPVPAPARPDEQRELWPTSPPRDARCEPSPVEWHSPPLLRDEFDQPLPPHLDVA